MSLPSFTPRSTSESRGSCAPGAPSISFVVPSWNMAPLLELSLECFAHVHALNAGAFEIVIVDDGSDDDTPALLERWSHTLPCLRSIRRERDEHSCRARARNLGAHASRGQYLVFLDAGVLVRADFIVALTRAIAEHAEAVQVISTLGLFAWQTGIDFRALLALFRGLGDTLPRVLEALARDPAWCERRQALFAATGGDLSRLPAPWLLAWTAALALPRARFDAAGGFDERFLRWGGEDCDFALALHDTGAQFRAFTAQSALHVPHPTEPVAVKHALNLEHARRIHSKRPCRETELFATLGDPFAVNELSRRLDSLSFSALLPAWDGALLDAADDVLSSAASTLWFGVPDMAMLERFPRASFAVPTRALRAALLACGAAEPRVLCALGCYSSGGESAHDAVILTDLLRLLPRPIQTAQLNVATRLGRRAYLFCREQPAPVQPATPGAALCSITELLARARTAGFVLQPVAPQNPQLHGYELTRAR